jgi:ATP-dependent protease ClpP protease subunit
MEFLYTVDPSADEPIMLVSDFIGRDPCSGKGVDGAEFQAELLLLDSMGKKRIQVWINSPGGSVLDGFAMCNAVLKSKTPVDTYNAGVCASIAGVLFMTGRKRVMADYSTLMIHPPAGGEDKKALDALGNSIVTLLSAKSNLSEKDVRYLMDRTTWLTSAECFEKGFCTDIEVTSETNQRHMPSTAKAMWMAGNEILNSLFHPNNSNMALTKITMKLGLNEAASEDNIVTAIKSIEDKAYKAETDLLALQISSDKALKELTNATKAEVDAAKAATDKAKEDMDKMKAELAAKQKAYDDCKAALDAMTNEKKAAEEEAKNVAAKAMVENFAKIGRIKNEAPVIEKWVALAKADLAGTKEMIEALPLNVKAPVIPIENKLGDKEIPTNAMGLAVKNKLRREGKLA